MGRLETYLGRVETSPCRHAGNGGRGGVSKAGRNEEKEGRNGMEISGGKLTRLGKKLQC